MKLTDGLSIYNFFTRSLAGSPCINTAGCLVQYQCVDGVCKLLADFTQAPSIVEPSSLKPPAPDSGLPKPDSKPPKPPQHDGKPPVFPPPRSKPPSLPPPGPRHGGVKPPGKKPGKKPHNKSGQKPIVSGQLPISSSHKNS